MTLMQAGMRGAENLRERWGEGVPGTFIGSMTEASAGAPLGAVLPLHGPREGAGKEEGMQGEDGAPDVTSGHPSALGGIGSAGYVSQPSGWKRRWPRGRTRRLRRPTKWRTCWDDRLVSAVIRCGSVVVALEAIGLDPARSLLFLASQGALLARLEDARVRLHPEYVQAGVPRRKARNSRKAPPGLSFDRDP